MVGLVHGVVAVPVCWPLAAIAGTSVYVPLGAANEVIAIDAAVQVTATIDLPPGEGHQMAVVEE